MGQNAIRLLPVTNQSLMTHGQGPSFKWECSIMLVNNIPVSGHRSWVCCHAYTFTCTVSMQHACGRVRGSKHFYLICIYNSSVVPREGMFWQMREEGLFWMMSSLQMCHLQMFQHCPHAHGTPGWQLAGSWLENRCVTWQERWVPGLLFIDAAWMLGPITHS